MVKAIKILGLLLVLLLIGIMIWGYAPDRDIAELRAEYGAAPSQILPLPNGQNIHIRDQGPRQAPVLLLLHGSSSSLHTWQGWTDSLKDSYRIITMDLPGHGLTGPQVDGDYSTAAFTSTVMMTMQQLGIDRYIVAGNSMGGWVAWNVALADADKVSGLILLDSSGAPDAAPQSVPIGFQLAQSEFVRSIGGWFTPRKIIDSSIRDSVADPSKVTDEQVDRYWHLLRYPGNRYATFARGDFPRDAATPEKMAKITVPALILWGAKDRLIPIAAANWFDTHLPRSSKIIYPDLAHLPMEEAPQRTADDVRIWLKDVGLDQPEPAQTAKDAAKAMPGAGA